MPYRSVSNKQQKEPALLRSAQNNRVLDCVYYVCLERDTHAHAGWLLSLSMLTHISDGQQDKRTNNEQTKQQKQKTDLSAAGPPAELKHITQRRKRKQP